MSVFCFCVSLKYIILPFDKQSTNNSRALGARLLCCRDSVRLPHSSRSTVFRSAPSIPWSAHEWARLPQLGSAPHNSRSTRWPFATRRNARGLDPRHSEARGHLRCLPPQSSRAHDNIVCFYFYHVMIILQPGSLIKTVYEQETDWSGISNLRLERASPNTRQASRTLLPGHRLRTEHVLEASVAGSDAVKMTT